MALRKFTIRIPEDLYQRLKASTTTHERSMNNIVVMVLRRWLEGRG